MIQSANSLIVIHSPVMDIQIRLAKSEDIEDILEIQANSIRILSYKEYNAKQIESLIRGQKSARLASNEITFLADCGDKLVGFAALSAKTPQVNGIFVHSNYVRQGIGTKLLQAVEDVAIEKKYRIIYVYASLSAATFYQVQGYEITAKGGFRSEKNTWIPCLSMRKELIPGTEKEKWPRRIVLITIGLVMMFIVVARLFSETYTMNSGN
jgi:putative acetyltransferase